MERSLKTLTKLVTSSFGISLFIIGGGYVAIPMLQRRFVDELQWIGKEEMSDLVAIAQAAPGAIAVNSALSVGYRVAGVPGAICTLLGTVAPPLLIISVLQVFYAAFIGNPVVAAVFRGMNAAVAAIMVDVVIKMGKDARKGLARFGLPLMAIAFALAFLLRVNPAFIVLAGIAAGLAPAGLRVLRNRRKAAGAAAPATGKAADPDNRADPDAGDGAENSNQEDRS